MIAPGLCSVTFRALPANEVIELAVEAGMEAVEWGGDVHVPLGALDVARQVGEATRRAGFRVASYGSYVVAGKLADGEIEALFDTACALGAPHARVWCRRGVEDVDALAPDLRALASAGAARGVAVSTEFHPGTVTETAAGACALLDAVGEDVATYWQPHPLLSADANLAELRALGDRVSHLHVFCWRPDGTRLPLADGADLWPAALGTPNLRSGSNRGVHFPAIRPRTMGAAGRVAFLEFVRDDDPACFLADAAVLRSWLS